VPFPGSSTPTPAIANFASRFLWISFPGKGIFGVIFLAPLSVCTFQFGFDMLFAFMNFAVSVAPAEVVVKGFHFRTFWVHLHILSAKRRLIVCLLGAKKDNC